MNLWIVYEIIFGQHRFLKILIPMESLKIIKKYL